MSIDAYGVCPSCGSKDLTGRGFEVYGMDVKQTVKCNQCGCSWVDRFEFVEVTELDLVNR